MGCAGSKQSKCRHCQAAPYSPMSRRSFSMNVHHPPEKRGDSYHVVALTSSTLGSIKLDEANNSMWDEFDQNGEEESETYERQKPRNYQVGGDKTAEFTMGMIEAKAWSKMIDEKITRVAPRTPVRTPPGEPETINVEELMEGLEESSPLRLPEHVRSFSFHVSADSIPPLVDSPRAGGGVKDDGLVSPKKTKTKTIWFDSQEKEESNCELVSKALVSEFDPEVISAFRKALEELSPTNPFYLKPRDGSLALEVTKERLVCSDDVAQEKKMSGFDHVNGFVDRIVIEEEKENLAPSENGDGSIEEDMVDADEDEDEEDGSVVEHEYESEDYSKERVILYFTSLRGVRKTHEDCSYVRVILKGLGVRVDERDVSMHSGFRDELKELLGEGVKGGLPKVFIGEKYIGGVDEIRRLHEDGKLEKVVEGCEMMDDDGGNLIDVCDACGDVRFVPCETCSGSCKIYYECEEHDEEYEEDEYGFQRCPDCNENGLVRCPLCCY